MLEIKPIKPKSIEIPKPILVTAKFLEIISPKLATLFAVKLFSTPIKYKIPKRELEMNRKSKQLKLLVPTINKEIVVYFYGESSKKTLIVHGWSGRGTQLYKIADELLKNGFSTVSFDAPAHGKSKGNTTLMPEFIASILEIEKQFGPFEFAVGHSLGGMSVLNALQQKLNIKKAVIIGSGDIISDIAEDFIENLKLNSKIAPLLIAHFERKYELKMNDFSSSVVAKNIEIPVLIIHDNDDDEVNVLSAYQIEKVLKNSELMITEKLGHRKILGNKLILNKIIEFLKK